ncbi:MAG TPA: twin-arginine translocation signal domain-containing protein [Acidobacteriaceae bacterium]|nr:twin-arginine translocation signal domain-containing protein [Acidobacteriaceae bacterium]
MAEEKATAGTNPEETISRRDFVKTAAATAMTAGMALKPATSFAAAPETQQLPKTLIGFQAEVNYVLQYGVARFLDDIQTRANVNTLMLHGNPFEASWAGLDKASNPTGNFATAHPQYYKDIKMEPHALSPGDFNLPDAMEKITTETKKRGIKVIPWMEEDNRARPPIKGMEELYEVDLYGRRTSAHPGGPCLNNPYFRNLLWAQVEDFVKSYDVDGLQRGTERQGPMSNALGAWHHGAKSDPGHTSCFCEYCAAKAAKQGIDMDRVKKAFLVLEPYVRNGRAGKRPRDGYYVEFWRILLQHPELLVWQTFWSNSMRETQREFSAKAKALRPGIPIGYHIWQNISFNPVYRAEQDYADFTEFADFVKPALYDNPAGERMTSFVDSMTQNVFGDLSRPQMLDFEYSVMDFKEKSYAEIIGRTEAEYASQLKEQPINGTPRGPFERFSSDYVYRETKRAMDGVAGSKTRVCPGLGIDVQLKNSTPESVRDCVEAILRAGGTGFVISTSHAAMRPENLSSVGATLKELKMA